MITKNTSGNQMTDRQRERDGSICGVGGGSEGGVFMAKKYKLAQ